MRLVEGLEPSTLLISNQVCCNKAKLSAQYPWFNSNRVPRFPSWLTEEVQQQKPTLSMGHISDRNLLANTMCKFKFKNITTQNWWCYCWLIVDFWWVFFWYNVYMHLHQTSSHFHQNKYQRKLTGHRNYCTESLSVPQWQLTWDSFKEEDHVQKEFWIMHTTQIQFVENIPVSTTMRPEVSVIELSNQQYWWRCDLWCSKSIELLGGRSGPGLYDAHSSTVAGI